MKKTLSILLAIMMVLSCTVSFAEVPWTGEWYEPYDPNTTVTVNVAKSVDTGLTYIEGESISSNYLLNHIEESINADFNYEYEWDGSSYGEKISLAIASGDIPDVFVVNATQLKALIDADMIEPLTDYYEKYASPNLRKAYEDFPEISFGNAKKDGVLWAMPSLDCAESAMQLLWIRTDWLDKLGLKAPESMEDVIEIALAFKNNDPDGNGVADTSAIEGVSAYYNPGGEAGAINPLFHKFNAYLEYWYDDAEGNLVYGSVQPQVKEALTYINELVNQGVLEKDFATGNWDTLAEAVTNNKCGIFFAPWWYAGTIKTMTLQDPTIVWQTYFQPLDDNGLFNTTYGNVAASFCVVKKGLSEAEIASVIKAINIQWELDQDQGVSVMPAPESPYSWQMFPITYNVNRVDDKRIKADEVYKAAVTKELDPATLTGESLETYNSYVKYLEGGWDGLTLRDIHLVYHFMVAVLPMVHDVEMTNWVTAATFNVTDTMEERWATLSKLEEETFTKIMLGEESPDAFDSFVDQWYALGGEDIIDELNEMLGR